MTKFLGNNWKTTVAGILQAAALGYVGYTMKSPELMMAAAAALGQGVLSKDADK